MENKKIIHYVEALILLPILSMSGGVGNVPTQGVDISKASPVVFLQKQNIFAQNPNASNKAMELEAELKKVKAAAIDSYFTSRGMPLAGLGLKMVEEAEKNGLDWRLLAAISVRESTGGKFECKKADFNAFGWGSCKINFKSNEHAIEIVAKNLGGNNPNTAKHYEYKTTIQILRAYNPPSIVPRYAEQVINIMETIGSAEITPPSNQANS